MFDFTHKKTLYPLAWHYALIQFCGAKTDDVLRREKSSMIMHLEKNFASFLHPLICCYQNANFSIELHEQFSQQTMSYSQFKFDKVLNYGKKLLGSF